MLITCNGFKFFYNRFVHGVPIKEAAECIFSTQAISIEDVKHPVSWVEEVAEIKAAK